MRLITHVRETDNNQSDNTVQQEIRMTTVHIVVVLTESMCFGKTGVCKHVVKTFADFATFGGTSQSSCFSFPWSKILGQPVTQAKASAFHFLPMFCKP
jgi:hypothetical protein